MDFTFGTSTHLGKHALHSDRRDGTGSLKECCTGTSIVNPRARDWPHKFKLVQSRISHDCSTTNANYQCAAVILDLIAGNMGIRHNVEAHPRRDSEPVESL